MPRKSASKGVYHPELDDMPPTTIMHLRASCCRAVLEKTWLWRGRHALPFYCAAPSVPGASYCPEHAAQFGSVPRGTEPKAERQARELARLREIAAEALASPRASVRERAATDA